MLQISLTRIDQCISNLFLTSLIASYMRYFKGIIWKSVKHKNWMTQIQSHRDNHVRGSPQTRGYVHQTIASCKLFSKGCLQSKTTLLRAHLWFTLQELLTEYSFILTTGSMNSLSQDINTHHSLYIYVQTSGHSQSFIIKTKRSLYI